MEKTIAQKMGIQNNFKTIFIDDPEGIIDLIELPDVRIATDLDDDFDYIHLFVTRETVLIEKLPILKQSLKTTGMLWISWPKSGQLETDLNIKKVIRTGYDFGLVESKTISIDSVWSAIKFTFPKEGNIYKNSYGVLRSEEDFKDASKT